MEFLFFDIECANCFHGAGKMCEFGYVVTDEFFAVKEREVLLINPHNRFDPYVIKNLLTHEKREYWRAPSYPTVFNKIKSLFDRDMTVVGHSVNNDFRFLNDEARRYKLPFFNCLFYDVKEIYSAYKQDERGVGVKAICEELSISELDGHEHSSVDDAYATMLITKQLCATSGKSFFELVAIADKCRGENRDGQVVFLYKEEQERKREQERRQAIIDKINAGNAMRGDKLELFRRFIHSVRTEHEVRGTELDGKKVCVNRDYAMDHFKEMLGLVQLLKDRNCTYIQNPEASDIFVSVSTEAPRGGQLGQVMGAKKRGKDIAVVKLEEFLAGLGIDEKGLLDMPIPDPDRFDRAPGERRRRPRRRKQEQQVSDR